MQTKTIEVPLESRVSFKEKLRSVGSRLLPHDSKKTTCPPAPLVSGDGPTIIVASLMRSGTHLLLDALFNNFRGLRRTPLFLDFDAYERGSLPVAPLSGITGVIIKTHFPETPLARAYSVNLSRIASRAIVLTPRRSSEDVRRSLAKWGMNFSREEFAELEKRFDEYWSPFSPLKLDFNQLLHPDGVRAAVGEVVFRTGLKCDRATRPVMPAKSRLGVYVDKMLTRVAGSSAPRINTTIGYKLSPKQRA
jgi:hypothetical protein